VRAPHQVSISPTSSAQQSAAPGTTVYYHLEILNNDSLACGVSDFTFANASLPEGWGFAPTNGVEQVDAQELTGYSVWYTSPSDAYNGDYDFTVSVTRAEEPSQQAINLRYTVTGGQTEPTPVDPPVAAPDTTAPALAILSPTAGATVKKGSTVTISVSASDNIGIAQIDYFVDGSLVCTGSSTDCAWKTPARKGTFQIEVRASDAAGNTTSSFTSVKAL
jgi:hypothetical protein